MKIDNINYDAINGKAYLDYYNGLVSVLWEERNKYIDIRKYLKKTIWDMIVVKEEGLSDYEFVINVIHKQGYKNSVFTRKEGKIAGNVIINFLMDSNMYKK